MPAYTAAIHYRDSGKVETKTNHFVRYDRPFTTMDLETACAGLLAYTNCDMQGYSYTFASASLTDGESSGNGDRKVLVSGKDDEGRSYTWQFPDPTGTTSKPAGSLWEVIDEATLTGIGSKIATLVGKVIEFGVGKIIQRL
jgi:hypothetical protein